MQELLQESDRMEDAFRTCLSEVVHEPSRRTLVASSMCALALEHGRGLRTLLGEGMSSSALALFRCQFEITVRATWVAFAATDDWILRFTEPVQTLNEPVRSPSMSEMLESIANNAPRKASELLNDLKAATWKPLHSYVHGGVRPVAETLVGYDPEFLRKTLLNSNGLAAMAALVWAGLSSEPERAMQIVDVQYEFLHCLPPAGL